MLIIVSAQQSIYLYAYSFQCNVFFYRVTIVSSRAHVHATFWFLLPPTTICFLSTVIHLLILFLIKIYDHQSTTIRPPICPFLEDSTINYFQDGRKTRWWAFHYSAAICKRISHKMNTLIADWLFCQIIFLHLQYLCQTLDHTFAKRWKTLVSNVE